MIVIPLDPSRPLLGIDVKQSLRLLIDDPSFKRWIDPLSCLLRDTYQMVPTNEALTCWITFREYWLADAHRRWAHVQIPIFTPPGRPHWLTVLNPQETNP